MGRPSRKEGGRSAAAFGADLAPGFVVISETPRHIKAAAVELVRLLELTGVKLQPVARRAATNGATNGATNDATNDAPANAFDAPFDAARDSGLDAALNLDAADASAAATAAACEAASEVESSAEDDPGLVHAQGSAAESAAAGVAGAVNVKETGVSANAAAAVASDATLDDGATPHELLFSDFHFRELVRCVGYLCPKRCAWPRLPSLLLDELFESDLHFRPKFLTRTLPVDLTANSNKRGFDAVLSRVVPLAQDALSAFLRSAQTVRFEISKRNNSLVPHDQLLAELGRAVAAPLGLAPVYKNADVTLFVEANGNFCGAGLARSFEARKKYNLAAYFKSRAPNIF